ncbi:MAG TPA: SH3 domain-containing protein [Anaerolineales bacterium]|nr:SH3 domain-containing protein [Anaerolineales bacterium]
MLKKYILPLIILVSLASTACGNKATATEEVAAPVFTSTPDLCSSENLPEEVAKVNKLTREFDDYSALASNTPQSQLVQVIPDMQRVLRDAEDQSVPACLTNLKKLQIAHMSVVVQTLMAFLNTSDTAGVEKINAAISQARNLHGQYDLEMARLLGITLVAPPTLTPLSSTPEVNVAPATTTVTSGFVVTNPGPARVNLRSAPDLNATEAGLIEVQASMLALGKTVDNQWIQVQIPGQPGQTAWVYAILVQLSVPIDQLPVITP